MNELGRRIARLWLLPLVWGVAVAVAWGATPATTRISDVVYRGDGTPASGTLLISWPAFTAAGNVPVAAGSKSVTLGLQGALVVDLVPNEGGIPSNTVYKIVYHLDDGTVECLNASIWNKALAK
ncbi:MAG TPA: hypothetical protein VGF08_14095 [Terriglobales bacterium]|jgi:hypothetical protein